MNICVNGNTTSINIGRVGEHITQFVVFDFTAWKKEFGQGTIFLLHKRSQDSVAYPISLNVDDAFATWTITSSDTQFEGVGECELVYIIDNRIAKSKIWKTINERSLDGSGDVPEPWQPWVDEILEDGALIKEFLATLEGGLPGQVWTKTLEGAEWQDSQGGGDTHPYSSLTRLGEYLYEITFVNVPDFVEENVNITGACSSYVNNGKLYRNLDWGYSNLASFHVVCSDFEGMAFSDGLTDTSIIDVIAGQLPYRVVDGCNNHGIRVSTHVLFNDWEWNGAGETPLYKLPYIILSTVKNLDNLELQLSEVLDDLHATTSLVSQDYLLQFIVTDGASTYAIVPSTEDLSAYEVVDITSNPKLTNFRWVDSEIVDRQDLQTRPTGVERWNMMPCPLADLKFTAAYETPERLSEFIGINGTTKDSTDEELEAIYELARQKFLERERNGETWQTMHSVVYGENGLEELYVQENWEKNYISGVGKTDIPLEVVNGMLNVIFYEEEEN